VGRSPEHSRTIYGGEEGWVTADVFRVTRNSIDYAVDVLQESYRYEGQCLHALEKYTAPGEFIIGPHINDVVFGMNKEWCSRGRSDAMIFETDHGTWTLNALAEFKSGHVKHLFEKCKQFSCLLSYLREDPEFLPEELKRIAGDFYPTPTVIQIPDDKFVRVIVVSRPGIEHPKVKHGRFPLEYMSVA
jgi:hypothetical protein